MVIQLQVSLLPAYIVLVDLRMRKMKQNEIRAGATCRRLGIRHAQSEAIRKVPIVMIAASAEPEQNQSCVRPRYEPTHQ